MTNGESAGIGREIRENLSKVREQIGAAARRAGRKPEEITLVTVSKGISPEITALAAAEGVALFGESKVQEAQEKIPKMPAGLEWHMIGRLQSNKVREALHLFSLIHSVDRDTLATAIDRHARENGKPARILVQVNITGSTRQGGVPIAEIQPFIDKMSKLDYLRICGLMAIGPYPAGVEELRGAYRNMRVVFDRLARGLGAGFNTLSTGMSGDFEAAIEEGSNLVRIGTAIFGDRRYK
jgi:pyridoxal phosphate enzyme (YggS family)